MNRAWPLLACLLLAGCAPPSRGETALGDAGHYLTGDTQVLLSNPTGRAFQVTLRRFPWWIGGGWNQEKMPVCITAPDGSTAVDTVAVVGDEGATIEVPAGPKGVYTLSPATRNGLHYWYLTASLRRSVAWARVVQGDAFDDHWFMCNPFVPRRWYFWVPPGTKDFTVVAQNCRGRSQREDHGLTVFSPRGQRFAVLWGQANADEPTVKMGKHALRLQKAHILVEPGSAGRFWAIDVRMGDSHTYSDVNFALVGVPPYVSRSPEEWFDASTGKPPEVPLYDDSEFVQSDRSAEARARHPLVHHWTPCPALGDPDACELRCPARIALWNPEGRELKFVIGTYLPRNMFPGPLDPKTHQWPKLADADHDHALVAISGPRGRALLKERVPLKHLHGEPGYMRILRPGPGVTFIDVQEAVHFWTYTYPATPAVLVGRDAPDGWRRFRLDAGTARNWYFLVPRGTTEFSLRASAADATDVMLLEVGSPDRVVAMAYGRSAEKTIAVPQGMDGKVWHVRLDFGGATRFVSSAAKPRFPSLDVTLELKGVPAYLAPTWEQWFDPRHPAPPLERAGR